MLRLTTTSLAASVVGELANFVVAVDSLRPAKQFPKVKKNMKLLPVIVIQFPRYYGNFARCL